MPNEIRRAEIAESLAVITEDTALAYLHRYYGLGPWDGLAFTGSHFDGRSKVSTNRIVAEDIIAVGCLSIHVPAAASVEILGKQADEIASLLSDIPDLNLEDISPEQHEEWLGDESAAFRLWRLLRQLDGVGPTTASKLMARKRPGLIPIYDSVVARVTGFHTSAGTWHAWHSALSNEAFKESLQKIRSSAALEHISLLRVLDVVLWMEGKGFQQPERVDQEVSA
ncbi:hypothetical protein QF031_003030 [Pseudarthrobacter defluvii]|uniref:DUF6308 family protein n=1 Tax=Pseudarthrobacter defluvii TaxID=410837 RepID=UPI0027892605|nr:DUF6308 family protein [Pseudarthrobacter defluvii]MDQ0770281.1 hypothetical protein [Pseudarthrobacter defluvii]